MTRTLDEVIESIRQLAEAKQCIYYSPDEGGAVGTSSYEPDPAYVPLLALLQPKDIPIETSDGHWAQIAAEEYWQNVPDGAPEGALMKALLECMDALDESISLGYKAFDLLVELRILMDSQGDTRLAAFEVVEAWLKEGRDM